VSEVYLDYNATAPVRPGVAQAVLEVLGSGIGNPSSTHRPGHRAKILLESARESVASLLGASSGEIVFTSGGTEANNLAIFGTALRKRSGHILLSAIEHASVLEPTAELERRGYRITRVAPDGEGWIPPDSVLQELSEDTILVSVMHANHEVGTLQGVETIAKGLAGRGVLFHCDAVQSAGKVPLDIRTLGVDLLSLSSHKIGGPAGVGCLWIREGAPLEALLRGGGQETNRRAGTQALPLIAGFGVAARLARQVLEEERERLRALRDRLEEDLTASYPGVRIHGRNRSRVSGTSHFSFPGIRAEDLVSALDLEGVAVSAGSACDAGTLRPSHVLKAMGCSREEAESSIRLSLGHASEPEHVSRFMVALGTIVARLPGLARLVGGTERGAQGARYV
jgi:cysteine desulfurase